MSPSLKRIENFGIVSLFIKGTELWEGDFEIRGRSGNITESWLEGRFRE